MVLDDTLLRAPPALVLSSGSPSSGATLKKGPLTTKLHTAWKGVPAGSQRCAS
jgi:hypothetical protein